MKATMLEPPTTEEVKVQLQVPVASTVVALAVILHNSKHLACRE